MCDRRGLRLRHVLVETSLGNLSEFMRYLINAYIGSYNRRSRRVGHLCQGRYKAILYIAIFNFLHPQFENVGELS